ncbi:MAG: DMT family transporter [Coriobacteriales bacterium]|nr:DMT family transporter [Coriobacteriales bacterium]
MIKNTKLAGHLLALGTSIVWGLTFVSTKVLLVSFTAVEVLLYRFVLGYAALCVGSPKPLRFLGLKREAVLFLAGAVGTCGYYLFENLSLTYTFASNSSVIVSTAPLFTALATWIAGSLEGKQSRPHLSFFVGFVVAISGIALISFGDSEFHASPIGDLLACAAASTWGIYSVLLDKAMTWGYSALQITRRIFAYGIVLMVPIAFMNGFEFGLERFADPANTLNMLFLGIVACAVCFSTWNYAIKAIGPVASSVYIYLQPAITVIGAAIILQEPIAPYIIIGIILVLCGLIISQRKPA